MKPTDWECLIRQLCRADPHALGAWLAAESERLRSSLILILVGGGLYGATLGIWRAPMQAVFVAIKFPLLLLFTAAVNALINAMLARLLGAPMNFRQSLLAVLMSFALLAVMLAAFTPLILFLLWNLPGMDSGEQAGGHRLYLLANVLVIAFAGGVANVQLYRLLAEICASTRQAARILGAWLATNLFVGAQISWNLRPFFGTPGLPVAFLRDDPFAGSFYEAVFYLLKKSLGA